MALTAGGDAEVGVILMLWVQAAVIDMVGLICHPAAEDAPGPRLGQYAL
jgi:hypothetical protein